MARIAVFGRRDLARYLAALLLGFLGGHALATTLWAARVDRLMLSDAAQKDRISRLENDVERLEASLSERRQTPLQKLLVTAPDVKDERLRLRVEGIVYDLLKHLVGVEMNRIDPETMQKLAERTVTIDQTSLTLRVIRLIAWESTLSLTIDARSQ